MKIVMKITYTILILLSLFFFLALPDCAQQSVTQG